MVAGAGVTTSQQANGLWIWWVCAAKMGTDEDNRGLGMHKERALDGRKADALRECKGPEYYTRLRWLTTARGWNIIFRRIFGGFRVLGSFPELKVLRSRKRWTFCAYLWFPFHRRCRGKETWNLVENHCRYCFHDEGVLSYVGQNRFLR